MSDPMEITKDITVAWLNAYETDLAVRRQKGVVPLFTPTVEEVMDFISATYSKVSSVSQTETVAEAVIETAAEPPVKKSRRKVNG